MSGNGVLYYTITYPVICVLFITVFCTLSLFSFYINMSHNSKYYMKKIKPKEAKQTRSIDSFLVTMEKKKLNENDDEIRVCEVKCQTHSNNTEILIVLLLLLKVVKWNHRVHLLLQTAQITLKIQSWMKIIQHSLSRI